MQGSTKIPITDLNEHITCKICNGYFIDATTIIECLHTFCRSCIVKFLEKNKYCPVCDVLVHKTKPLLNIRSDKTIQDIVYKLVPRLFQNEMQKRRTFYENHPDSKPTSLEQCGEASYQYLLTAEESICLTLSYHGSDNKPRYLRCPAAVSVGHLKKLIRAKYDLSDNHKVDILYNQDCLNHNLTLMDVAYIYLWKRKEPMQLTYRIYECTAKKPKLDHENADTAQANNNNNWKEVQLRISENGEMSITGIQEDRLSPSLLEIVNNESKYKDDGEEVDSKSVKNNVIKKELPGLKFIGKGNTTVESPPVSIANSTCTYISTSTSSTLKNECCSPSTVENVNSTTISTKSQEAVQTVGTLSCISNTSCNYVPSFSSTCSTLSCATTTTVYSTINNSKCSTKSEEIPSAPFEPQAGSDKSDEVEKQCIDDKIPPSQENSNVKTLKRKLEAIADCEPPVKQQKQTILNHSIGLLNLSNNHPLKKHSKLNRNGENLKDALAKLASSSDSEVVTKTSNSVMKCVNTISTSEITISKLTSNNNSLLSVDRSRPETPVSKSLIMSTKSSIIPSKTNAITYSPAKPPCYMPQANYNPIITVPKPTTSISQVTRVVESRLSPTTCASVTSPAPRLDNKQNNTSCSQQQPVQNATKAAIKTKPSTPIGYKTLRDPPKSWNSQISKANLCKTTPEPKPSDLKNVRPAKFFKMRNNIPRYLGNPASGVKPMYQVHVSPDKDKSQDVNKMEKSEIKKHSIVKIDPKTLKPISEKAPETTSLSNHISTSQSLTNHNLANLNYTNQIHNIPIKSNPKINIHSDLRINTSSVSIFSPLKLQSSPKNDRKSPKSPHSPKHKATSSPTGSKREKANLNFTPANPFIPNLTSPTMSPNQFLYPTGPPGFPPYDPRVMAAYHNLWYGPRMSFPTAPIPGLNLNLEMLSSPSSPKMGALSQTIHNHQIPSRPPSTTSPNISPLSRTHRLLPSPTMSKPVNSNKRSSRESKNEKSLQNAVEKLTQNRKQKPVGNESSASSGVTMQKQGKNVKAEQSKVSKVIEETPKEIVTNENDKVATSEGQEALPASTLSTVGPELSVTNSLTSESKPSSNHPSKGDGERNTSQIDSTNDVVQSSVASRGITDSGQSSEELHLQSSDMKVDNSNLNLSEAHLSLKEEKLAEIVSLSEGAESNNKLEENLLSQSENNGLEECKPQKESCINKKNKEEILGSSNVRNKKNGDSDNDKGSEEVSTEDYPKYLGFQFF
ncbi:unnamed protein product [Phaedon cochleariae]|uniref:RING-type domain-containing protein n=1 Tax=Phaedon cochleariae TaxID=80249 RepID=A0A9N9X3E9_PHACE|nr:unnamed protein product [Phaedon cochleariae]